MHGSQNCVHNPIKNTENILCRIVNFSSDFLTSSWIAANLLLHKWASKSQTIFINAPVIYATRYNIIVFARTGASYFFVTHPLSNHDWWQPVPNKEYKSAAAFSSQFGTKVSSTDSRFWHSWMCRCFLSVLRNVFTMEEFYCTLGSVSCFMKCLPNKMRYWYRWITVPSRLKTNDFSIFYRNLYLS